MIGNKELYLQCLRDWQDRVLKSISQTEDNLKQLCNLPETNKYYTIKLQDLLVLRDSILNEIENTISLIMS